MEISRLINYLRHFYSFLCLEFPLSFFQVMDHPFFHSTPELLIYPHHETDPFLLFISTI